jgi:nucleoside-diphosphate-sugar epimerase
LTGQVHLDDVAKAHILALDQSRITSDVVMIAEDGHGWSWDKVVPVIQKLFPQAVKRGTLKPELASQDWPIAFDTVESNRQLGLQYLGIEEMVRSTVGQYLRLSGVPEA